MRRRGWIEAYGGSATELLTGGNILAEFTHAQNDLSGIIRMEILSSVLKSCLYIEYSRHLMKYLNSAIVFYVILGLDASRVSFSGCCQAGYNL